MAPPLLAAILADPADDTPRLVLSDWLEERGEADRAEFVRVQVELAHDWGEVNDQGIKDGLTDAGRRRHPRFAFLAGRERELLKRHWGNWVPIIVGCAWKIDGGSGIVVTVDESRPGRSALFVPTFRRGFVAHVTCAAADWIAHGDALLAAQPIAEVALTTWPEVDCLVLLSPSHIYEVRLRGLPRLGWRNQVAAPGERAPMIELLAAGWPRIRRWTLPSGPA